MHYLYAMFDAVHSNGNGRFVHLFLTGLEKNGNQYGKLVVIYMTELSFLLQYINLFQNKVAFHAVCS